MLKRTEEKSITNLAIIGCGAVTELCHLPGSQFTNDVKIAALIDKDLLRAKLLSEKYGIKYYGEDMHQLPDDIEGVIIAIPNHLHASVTSEFLERKIPVLVEKPIALTLNEAEAMVKLAENKKVALQVGLMLRFCNGAIIMKRAVKDGWLGKLKSFYLESGIVYNWPIKTNFIINKEQAGGGELMDIGSHMLDLLIWIVGDAVDVEYRDDSYGGVEADCEISLVLKNKTGTVHGNVTLSRLRKLNDVVRIVGENFTMEYDLSSTDKVRIFPSNSDAKNLVFTLNNDSLPSQRWNQVYAEQLRTFAHAVRNHNESAIPGKSVLGSMKLIEQCYRERKPLKQPWMDINSSF